MIWKMLKILNDITVHGAIQLQRCLDLLDFLTDVLAVFFSSRREMNDIVQFSYPIL